MWNVWSLIAYQWSWKAPGPEVSRTTRRPWWRAARTWSWAWSGRNLQHTVRHQPRLGTPTLTYGGEHGGGVVEGAGELPGHARLVRFVQQHHLLEQVEIILTMIPRCRYLECLCNKGVPGDWPCGSLLFTQIFYINNRIFFKNMFVVLRNGDGTMWCDSCDTSVWKVFTLWQSRTWQNCNIFGKSGPDFCAMFVLKRSPEWCCTSAVFALPLLKIRTTSALIKVKGNREDGSKSN